MSPQFVMYCYARVLFGAMLSYVLVWIAIDVTIGAAKGLRGFLGFLLAWTTLALLWTAKATAVSNAFDDLAKPFIVSAVCVLVMRLAEKKPPETGEQPSGRPETSGADDNGPE